MKICVFGAGAVGGHITACLARAGADVSVVARGRQLEAIRSNGLRLLGPDDDFTVRVRASDDAAELGRHDLVVSAVKAQSLPGCVDAMLPLLGPATPVVFAVNGIPWWYFQGVAGADPAARLPRLDPDGGLHDRLGVHRAVGCVVLSANEIVEPGVVRRYAHNEFVIGEPDGTDSARLGQMTQALRPGLPGLRSSARLRTEIWTKLLANMASSPLSCLTDSTGADFLQIAELSSLFERLMAEGRAVALAHGVAVAPDEGAVVRRQRLSRHPPSMLQDLRAGRPIEIDAQLHAVQDLARMKGVATPWLDVVAALLAQRATPPHRRASGLRAAPDVVGAPLTRP